MNTFAVSKVDNTQFDSNKNNTRYSSEHLGICGKVFLPKCHSLVLHMKKLKPRDTLKNTTILRPLGHPDKLKIPLFFKRPQTTKKEQAPGWRKPRRHDN